MNDVVRSVRALGWLRWRLFVNALKGTRRRDTLERLSRAGSAIVPIILALMFVPSFLASCVLSVFGGWAVGQRIQATPEILGALRGALGLVTALILFIPAIRTARGPSTNMVRLALLPVPRTILHAADLLSGLADPWLALVVPVMLLFPVGMMVSGRILSGLIALLAGLALLVALLALESSASSLLALLYRDRRRGEIVTLVVLLALSTMGFLPMMMSGGFDEKGWHPRDQGRASRRSQPGRASEIQPPPLPVAPAAGLAGSSRDTGTSGVADASGGAGTSGAGGAAPSGGAGAGTPATPDPAPVTEGPGAPSRPSRENDVHFPLAASLFPSELYARALFEPLRGRVGLGLLGLLGVAAIGTALYGLSWTTYRRLLDSPENISPRRGARAEPKAWRLPGLGPAVSAVAQAQFRNVLRTVHGKMAVFFTPLSLLFAWLAISRVGRGSMDQFLGHGAASPLGPLIAYGGATLSLFAPQRFLLNSFATDGAGLTLALLSPISDRELVVGKSVGMAILSAIPLLIITTFVAVLSPAAPIALWAAVFVATAASHLILAPAGAIVSALFPKTVNMNRLSGASNPNGIASLLGVFLTAASCGPPLLVAAGTFLATRSPILALLAVLGYAVVAAGISLLLTHAAARVLAGRRENLALVAQGR